MLTRGNRVVVAVSGGPDSVVLLHVLHGLRQELELELEVAHLMHGLRGEEARQDAWFVSALAREFGLPFHLKEIDLPRIKSVRGKGNIEALGRGERYLFFAAVAEQVGAAKIATGHTRDDQVETFLMWLLRGAGRKAVGGIPPMRPVSPAGKELSIVRPLIETSRTEVMAYLAERGLEYRVDRTNLDPKLLRNWIRLRLLPELEAKTDSHLNERLAHMADVFREEETILDRLARNRLSKLFVRGRFLRESLLGEERGIQRRLIRLWLESTMGNLQGIRFDHVEALLRLIVEGPPQGRLSLPRAWDAVRQYEVVFLEKRKVKKSQPQGYHYILPLEGEIVIPEAEVRVKSSRCSSSPIVRTKNDLEAFFDLSVLGEPLALRNFQSGDRFQPLGMRGRKKVKDLFIERKVPLDLRRIWPFLVAGGQILWIPRYGRSELAKVGPTTTDVLKVQIEVGVRGSPG
jgi:tRNA(Ile)-lysidine synthase